MSDLDERRKEVEAAIAMLESLCEGKVRWHMSIPVRADDPDIVISDGLAAARTALARAEAAEAKVAALPVAAARFCIAGAYMYGGTTGQKGLQDAANKLEAWLDANTPQEEPRE